MDSYRISNGPTSLDLGSYMLPDGVDFDFGNVLKARLSENPYSEGGQLSVEDSSSRTFKFPLRIASSGAFTGGVDGLEQLLRNLARPGGYIDLQPEGLATANAVRFDVLSGRVLDSYSIFHQRVARRDLTLELAVPAYGYLPTLILLASAASVGLPGSLVVPGGSVLGDAPALAEIVVAPTSPTSYPLGTWPLDMLGWSLSARPSFTAFWPAASLAGAITASLAGDQFAPGSQALELFPSPTAAWANVAYADIPAALEPAYRGRFRLFTWANLSPSQALPWSVSADAVPAGNSAAALASAAAVASLSGAVRGGRVAAASPAYTLLDLGELTLPPVGSGVAQPLRIRLWADAAGTSIGIPTPILGVGGLYLLPVDGAAGILPRGLAQPSIAPVGSVGRLVLRGVTGDPFIAAPTANLSSFNPLADAEIYYRGALPKLGASNVMLNLLAGNYRMGAHSFLLDEAQAYPLIAYYRHADPAGASAVAAFPGFGPTGIATLASAGQPGALWGGPSHAARFFTGSGNSLAVASVVGMPSAFTLFTIFQRASAVASLQSLVGGGSAPQGFGLFFEANTPKAVYGAAVATGAASYPDPDASYHSLGMTVDGGGSPIFKLYYDGSLLGTHQGGSWGAPTHVLYWSAHRGFPGSNPFPGLVSETILVGAELTGTQMTRLHNSAFAPTGGATVPLVRASEARAAVSVSYQPRFTFLRGI